MPTPPRPSPHAPAFIPGGISVPAPRTSPPKPQNALGNVPCRYFRAGYCSRGSRCWFKHDTPGRTVTAMVDEPVAPEDEVCSICLDKVVAEYGLMTDCDHVFCLSCIRAWRDTNKSAADSSDYDTNLASISKTCPMCRKRSRFIVPSLVFPYPPKDGGENVLKKNIEAAYLRKLSSIPCKYFVRKEIEDSAAPSARKRNSVGSQSEFIASSRSEMPVVGSSSSASSATAIPEITSIPSPPTSTGASTSTSERIGPHARLWKLPLCPFGNECHYKHELVPGEKFVYTDADLSRIRRRAATARRRNGDQLRDAIGFMNRVYRLQNLNTSRRPRHFPRRVANTLRSPVFSEEAAGGADGLDWLADEFSLWEAVEDPDGDMLLGISYDYDNDRDEDDTEDVYDDDNDDDNVDDNVSLPSFEPANAHGGATPASGHDGTTASTRPNRQRRHRHRRPYRDEWDDFGLDETASAFLLAERERIRAELPDLPLDVVMQHLQAVVERGIDALYG